MRYEVRNSVELTSAAIMTLRCAVRYPRRIRIHPVDSSTADTALRVALRVGRSWRASMGAGILVEGAAPVLGAKLPVGDGGRLLECPVKGGAGWPLPDAGVS